MRLFLWNESSCWNLKKKLDDNCQNITRSQFLGRRVKPKCGGKFELLPKYRQGANFLAPLYFPSVKPFRWCPIHQKVIMKLRSSSVTRFKEEIGNEKTNITDGN